MGLKKILTNYVLPVGMASMIALGATSCDFNSNKDTSIEQSESQYETSNKKDEDVVEESTESEQSSTIDDVIESTIIPSSTVTPTIVVTPEPTITPEPTSTPEPTPTPEPKIELPDYMTIPLDSVLSKYNIKLGNGSTLKNRYESFFEYGSYELFDDLNNTDVSEYVSLFLRSIPSSFFENAYLNHTTYEYNNTYFNNVEVVKNAIDGKVVRNDTGKKVLALMPISYTSLPVRDKTTGFLSVYGDSNEEFYMNLIFGFNSFINYYRANSGRPDKGDSPLSTVLRNKNSFIPLSVMGYTPKRWNDEFAGKMPDEDLWRTGFIDYKSKYETESCQYSILRALFTGNYDFFSEYDLIKTELDTYIDYYNNLFPGLNHEYFTEILPEYLNQNGLDFPIESVFDLSPFEYILEDERIDRWYKDNGIQR
jgi:hypothetical protein